MADSTFHVFETEEAELARQRAEHDAAISRIQDRIEFLAELRKKIKGKHGTRKKPKASSEPSANGTPSAGLASPTEAIFAFLKRSPGSNRTTVLDNVVGHIKTTSKSPRDLVRTIIGQLVAKERLVEEDDGGLKVAKKE